MSAALIRQALEFVDQEGARSSGKKRRAPLPGQERRPRKSKTPRKSAPSPSPSPAAAAERADDNVKRLLALAAPAPIDHKLTDKLIRRAAKGQPLSDFVPVSRDHEPEQSILFPEESFKKFESELFTR